MLHHFLAVVATIACLASAQTVNPNIGHNRHIHHHNPKHPTEAPSPDRFTTSRSSSVVLPLPQEKDAFSFVVFGDRTGGPVDGVKVLADAVRDTNLLEPDLVMTVGDLINGYNARDAWMAQMKEYKEIMGELRCPWFPVAGNHDVYWRGPDRPKFEHDENYEMHFGPLWYAFEHKNSWFIALYSDETNPATGEKNFGKPENHRMSEEQFNWLKEILVKAKDADHVFLFLHHPRWIGGNYGNQWDRVHQLLVSAGNVSAVFAGHIHRMRYDPKDGIEYVTLATVGGGQSGAVPAAGWLHQYHIVTVRKDQIALAAVPVGEMMNVREITGEFTEKCLTQSRQTVKFGPLPQASTDGAVAGSVKAEYTNTMPYPIEITLMAESEDSRWMVSPDHAHGLLQPGETGVYSIYLSRDGSSIDAAYREPELRLGYDVMMPTQRYSMPEVVTAIPVNLDQVTFPAIATDMALSLDGDDALVIPVEQCNVPDGPFTLECWMNAEAFGERTGLLCKTESSDYGIFVSKGRPEFSVFVGGKYQTARAENLSLTVGQWYHIAGVFDGKQVRLYVDGRIVGVTDGAGRRKTNNLPLIVGADVSGNGEPNSFFKGKIDSVRLSTGARYASETFDPAAAMIPADTDVFLTTMDRQVGRAVQGSRAGKPAWVGRVHGSGRVVPR